MILIVLRELLVDTLVHVIVEGCESKEKLAGVETLDSNLIFFTADETL